MLSLALDNTVEELSDIERKTLSVMEGEKNYSFDDLVSASGLNPDSVRRASAWLLQKRLLQGKESKTKKLVLTPKGKKALEKGLPERLMLRALEEKQKMAMGSLRNASGLSGEEFNAALGLNKRNAFIMILKEKEIMIELT